MKTETIRALNALRDDIRRDDYGCGEPGYPGASVQDVARRLDELVQLLIADAEEEAGPDLVFLRVGPNTWYASNRMFHAIVDRASGAFQWSVSSEGGPPLVEGTAYSFAEAQTAATAAMRNCHD